MTLTHLNHHALPMEEIGTYENPEDVIEEAQRQQDAGHLRKATTSKYVLWTVPHCLASLQYSEPPLLHQVK